ncbi:MAG: ABC transporter ATP-binding protein, partial [Aeriscardovia sp.]|nr:ABC transporter ATP-binding protein [Aeriscardovia sp.]
GKETRRRKYAARKRVTAIERKLAKLRDRKRDLESRMAAQAEKNDYEELGRITAELQDVDAQSESLESEWIELGEFLES